jgi:uncharacterized membrane protein YgcG
MSLGVAVFLWSAERTYSTLFTWPRPEVESCNAYALFAFMAFGVAMAFLGLWLPEVVRTLRALTLRDCCYQYFLPIAIALILLTSGYILSLHVDVHHAKRVWLELGLMMLVVGLGMVGLGLLFFTLIGAFAEHGGSGGGGGGYTDGGAGIDITTMFGGFSGGDAGCGGF